MLKLLERALYGFHYVICSSLLLMPVANIIAIWVWPLRVFNVCFIVVVTVLQAIYWPECPLTLLYNKIRAINNPSAPLSNSFVRDMLEKFHIPITFKQVLVIQIVIFATTLATFLLWL